MIGTADIEESKSNGAMNAWLPQAEGRIRQKKSVALLLQKGECLETQKQNKTKMLKKREEANGG